MLEVSLSLNSADCLLDAKKKLLSEHGLSVKQAIKGIDDKHAFNQLLLAARILELDETELYFYSDLDHQKPISPRNEIQALTLIHTQLLQSEGNEAAELQKTVATDLNSLGKGDSKEPEAGQPCTTAVDVAVMEWSVQCGAMTKIQPAVFPSTGRGAQALEDIEPGDVIMRIPQHMLICSTTALESDMGATLMVIDGIDDDTRALLWTIRERERSASKFRAYFASLPAEFHTGFSMGHQALKELVGTQLLDEMMYSRQVAREFYDGMFPLLSDTFPQHFPEDIFSWENYLWATELWCSYGLKVLFPDGLLRLCLVPVAGLLNHSLYPHVTAFSRLDSGTNSLCLRAVRGCQKGQQCFLSYGPLSNGRLLQDYGFFLENNPYDTVPIELGEACEEEELATKRQKCLERWGLRLDSHLIRDCTLSQLPTWERPRILPKPLMAALRVSAMDEHELESFQGNPLTDKVSNQNEELALAMLREFVDALLESLPASNSLDKAEEDLDPEAHVAQHYTKSLEKLLQSVKDLCLELEDHFFQVNRSG